MMNASVCQMLRPSLAVPWAQQKPHLVDFHTNRHHRRRLNVPKAQLTTSGADNDMFKDAVKPWFSLFGMSVADAHKEFPETMWNVFGDSLETLRIKDLELNQNRWSTDADFDSGFVESIAFDKDLYKYVILAYKTNVDKIMNGGAISASDRDKIIHCLESIEHAIGLGKFEWIDGVDIYANIVEALPDKFGDIPKDLVRINKFDNCLMILEMWCKSYIDEIKTQMKQLQVALVLFALRIDCLDNCGRRKVQDNTFLESLVLPNLKTLEHDASDLRALLGFIYSSSDGVINLRNRFPEESSLSKRSTIAEFARSINYCIPNHLVRLLKMFIPTSKLILIRPHGEALEYWEKLQEFTKDEHMRGREHRHLALSKCLNLGGTGEVPQDREIQDAKCHLFSSVNFVLEMIKLCIECVENYSDDLKKVQIPHPRGYDDVMGFAHFLTSKGVALETAYAVVHLCLEKRVQPSKLTSEELARIDFPRERAHVLLHDKERVFHKYTLQDLDSCKRLIRWCCKLRISPDAVFERYTIYF
uniref:Uncharacterized protein n=1 Tax=Avena sativa TaxID=4498 RepID=A0ACD5WFF8_AVESA